MPTSSLCDLFTSAVPSLPPHTRRVLCVLLHAAWLAIPPGLQSDDVVIAKALPGRGTVRSTGEITDYTGKQLTLLRAGNRLETIDADRIIEVRTTRTAPHQAADEQFAERKFVEALASYQRALAEEPRHWMQRRILAQSIWCLRSVDRTEVAIDLSLQLYRHDPTTQFFDTFPVSWTTDPLSPALEAKARALLADGDLPVARLIGASWLLPTAQRAAAVATFQSLLTAEDGRIAYWAEAQLWRPQTATATAETIGRWHDRWKNMPTALQVGPAFVLAQAQSRLQQHEQAALLFLRAPILQPLDRGLASQALLAAGREFETMNQVQEATSVYREILTDHANSSAAPVAKERLTRLGFPPE